jgi:hypothetical protein
VLDRSHKAPGGRRNMNRADLLLLAVLVVMFSFS